MDRRSALPVVRATVGLLGLIALGYQIATSASAGTFDPFRFFAFFTVLSNLFAAFLLLAMATVWRDVHSRRVDLLRGAAVVYLVVTFMVVILFLSGEDLQVAVYWVDFIVHKLVPVYLVVDWLIDPPSTRLTGTADAHLAGLPARLGGRDPDPRRDRRLVPVSVPRPGERRVRQRRRLRGRDLRGLPRDRCGDDGGRQRAPRAPRRRGLDGLGVADGPIERRIQTPDGRTLAVAEWGDPSGFPVVAIHGTPGSRLGRWRDPSIYVRAGDPPDHVRSGRLRTVHAAARPARGGHRRGRPDHRRRARHRAVRGHRPIRWRPALARLRRAPARSGDPLRRGRRRRAVRRGRPRLVRGPDRRQRPRGRAVARRRGGHARAARRGPADNPRSGRQRRRRCAAGGLPAHRVRSRAAAQGPGRVRRA